MATLLFYEKPVPLNRDAHLQTRIGGLAGNYSFTSGTNSIPLAAVEFVDAAREFPVVFTEKEGAAQFPIALTGIRHSENLFVAADGTWNGTYIPAFVRRYPFVLAEKQDASDFNVYIDEAYSGFGAENGERLFTEDGEYTPLLKQALEFLSNYQGEIKRTRQFVDKLQELDLLIPRVLQVTRKDEAPIILQGFSVVDEQRLLALTDAQLGELARSGHLGWIYAHLMSLNNVSRLSDRLDARIASEQAAGAPAVRH